jgi:hypothetical protein
MRKVVCSTAALALLLQLALATVAMAAGIPGTWSLEASREGGRANFTLRADDPGSRSHNVSSHDIDPAELGLRAALSASAESKVAFTIVRDAGSFACSGVAGGGRAAGTFVFTPSEAFLAAMRERGYPELSAHQALQAASLDLTLAFVDGLIAAGYRGLPFEKLIAFRALGIDGDYARAMQGAFRGKTISAEDLIPLRALGVNERFVGEMRDAGLDVPGPKDAVRLRALNVDLAYVRELAAVGYAHLSFEAVMQLRALGIDAAYIKRVQAHGFPHPTIEELVRLKALNVVRLKALDVVGLKALNALRREPPGLAS